MRLHAHTYANYGGNGGHTAAASRVETNIALSSSKMQRSRALGVDRVEQRVAVEEKLQHVDLSTAPPTPHLDLVARDGGKEYAGRTWQPRASTGSSYFGPSG